MMLASVDYSLLLLFLIAVMAVLYSSVGHGGASGYLAAMALYGLAPDVMRPAALTMNVFVAGFVLLRLSQAGYFNGRLFLPIAVASMPMAYLGGSLVLDDTLYKAIAGAGLLLAALPLMFRVTDQVQLVNVKTPLAMLFGALLGFFAGLTGIGGGVYLSPLLLFLHWTHMRGSAAMAAAFVLVNSIAGLLGYISTEGDWPPGIPLLVLVALSGAVMGSWLGVKRLAPAILRRLLGLVLLVAGLKMVVATFS